ncbi:MAG: DUF4271 domain-containing protein [Sphingobacteriaceae bacterium]|nr:DUF4271 domain-containing protein [Sphingobacteriaceae bacterium]
MYKYLLIVLLSITSIIYCNAQTTNLVALPQTPALKVIVDSTYLKEKIRIQDSLDKHFIALKSEIATQSPILDSLLEVYYHSKINKNYSWNQINSVSKKNTKLLKTGKKLYKGEVWILTTLCSLLLLLIILKKIFEEDFKTISNAFFYKNTILKLSQRQTLFSSLGLLCFFIVFSFILSLYIYLAYSFIETPFNKHEFAIFIRLGIFILALYIFKIFIFKVFALFTNTKLIHDFISFVYVSFYSSALFTTPFLILSILSPLKYGYFCSLAGLIIISIIHLTLLLRFIRIIFKHNLVSILYLLLYFCTLEICPIIFLIKWLS